MHRDGAESSLGHSGIGPSCPFTVVTHLFTTSSSYCQRVLSLFSSSGKRVDSTSIVMECWIEERKLETWVRPKWAPQHPHIDALLNLHVPWTHVRGSQILIFCLLPPFCNTVL